MAIETATTGDDAMGSDENFIAMLEETFGEGELSEGSVVKASVLDVLPEIEADVAYFDPPYPGVMSYEKEYKVIDQILEGAQRETSPCTAKDGAAMIDGLFERAGHIPIWLLSLGNAVVPQIPEMIGLAILEATT